MLPKAPAVISVSSYQDACRRILLLIQGTYPPYEYGAEADAEQAQKKLADSSPELHAEGHALVFYKAEAKPLSYHVNLFPKLHIGLDQNFYELVDGHKQYC